MLIGAVAGSVPDLDILNSLWMDTAQELWHHRGITHSVFFGVLATILLALLAKRIWKLSLKRCVVLFGTNIFAHIFIDTFNTYGTAWFEPFSDQRISFNTLFVADPLFSLWPFIALIFLLAAHRTNPRRILLASLGLGLSGIYLCLALLSKHIATKGVIMSLKKSEINFEKYHTTPAPFNAMLWYTVAKDTGGYYIGFRSVFDSGPTTFTYFLQNERMLAGVDKRNDIIYLKKFADDFYTVEKRRDTTIFNVLRFGQVVGWHDPAEKFMLHYYVNYPNENKLVVQRGRFQRWDSETFQSFWKRIKGN